MIKLTRHNAKQLTLLTPVFEEQTLPLSPAEIIPSVVLGRLLLESGSYCRNNEHSSSEQLIKQVGRCFPSAKDDHKYLLLLRLQIVCQLLDTGWAIIVGSVAVNNVVHQAVPQNHFFSFNGLYSSIRRRFFPLFSELLLRDSPGIAVVWISCCFFSLLLRVYETFH